jgi:hypothetical protein
VRRMSENVKVEDLRPGDIVRDQEGGTGEVVRVYTYYLPFPGVHGVEVAYAPAVGGVSQVEDTANYNRGATVERVSGGEDA